MLKYLIHLIQGLLVQATSNLLASITPTITGAPSKFLGSIEPDPGFNDSGGIGDRDLIFITWTFSLESVEDVNTVGIFFKDEPEGSRNFEVRVGASSDISKNPPCAVTDTQIASGFRRVWLSCGFRGNFVSLTFCGDDDELEIRAYSLHGINFRKLVPTSAQLEGDRSSTRWVSQTGIPSFLESLVEGSIMAFSSAIVISYKKMANDSKIYAFFVTYGKKTQYPCEPVPSNGAFKDVICELRGDGIIFYLQSQDLPDSIFLLTESDPLTVKFDASLIERSDKKQLRQLQSCTGAGCGYCLNPLGMLNLLNTSVIAHYQNSNWPGHSTTPVTPCDGVVLPIDTSTFAVDYTKIAAPGSSGEFWKATFSATTSIKSSLIIHRDDGYKYRMALLTSTFGTNSDITLNPVFMLVGSLTDGGWYVCPDSMTGTIFAIYATNDFFDFVEVMLYSQEAIQMKALSAVATNSLATYPATNALQIIVVLLVELTTQKCVSAVPPATGSAKVEINLKAFGQINGVAVLPGYASSSSDWPFSQTNVAISVSKVGNIKHQCGVIPDYYSKYSEVACNVLANIIIIEPQTAGNGVRLCGVGVLSDCQCAQSSFNPASFTTAPTATLVSTNSMKKFVGETATLQVTVSLAIPDTISTICGNGDGFTKCGLRTIKFYDSSNAEIVVWPYLGIIWDSAARTISLPGTYQTPGTFTIEVEISLTSNPLANFRQTVTVAVNHRYCTNPTGMLNLLNTSVIAHQSSYWPAYSTTPVTPCDGVVLPINTSTYAVDYTKIAAPANIGPSGFWKATFSVTTSIKSSLIIHRDDCCKLRPPTWTSTFGTNSDITLNPVFMPVGSMTDGSWYVCLDSMTGTIFAIYSPTILFDFVEVMLYSQEAIQMKALSAVATNPIASFPASNALQNIVVLLYSSTRRKCVIAVAPPSGFAKIQINLKAFGQINGVAVLPGYATSSGTIWPSVQQNVAIQVNKVGNIKHQCGVMADYYIKYSEVACNVLANIITIEQQTFGNELRLCGVGVLSDCECAQSSFDPLLISSAVATPFASVTTLSLLPTDSIQTIKFNPLIPDTVSSICGTADGFTKCGLRQIIFTDKSTGLVISTWPYQAYDWNPLSSTLTVKPALAVIAQSVFNATLSLVSQPKVIYSQEITVNVAVAPLIKTQTLLFVPNQSLIAIINQEAILQLPDFGTNSSYALTGSQTYIAILEGTKLIVLSSNLADLGTQHIAMSLNKGNQTVNFKVNVVFTEKGDNKTAVQESSSQLASTVAPYLPKKSSKKKQEVPVISLPLIRPQIKFITNMALVNVTFNGNISANITKEQIQVRYIQNSNEIDQMNTFKWNITEVNTTWQENFMLIQLNFTDPILVSQGNRPDMLQVNYRNDYLYTLNKVAPFVDKNFTTVTNIMPMLAPSAESAQIIDTISTLASDAASSSFYTFLVAYLIVSTVMKYVWQTFNTLQIILMFPMLMVKMPVNVTNVQDSFKKIVNLDFIDKKKFYKVICEPLFGEIIESIKNPDYDSSGEFLAERSKNLVLQIVILAAFVIVIVALMVGLLVIRICAQKIKNQVILNAYKSLEAKVMFSSILRYGIQEYLKLSLTTLITFHDFAEVAPNEGRLLESADVAQQPDIKKIVISTLLTVFLILFPPFCVWFLRRYQIILYMEVMKMRFGTMYVGLNYYKRSSLVYLTIFLVRRLIFVVIIVYVTVNVQLQLLLSMYCSMFMLYYLIVYMPMWDMALNLIYLFNEGCLFICTAMQFLFTEYVPTPEDRFNLGWFYLGVVGFNVVGNGVYVVFDIQQQIKQRIFYKKERERKIQAREAARDAAKRVFQMIQAEEAKFNEDDWSSVSEAVESEQVENEEENNSEIVNQEQQWLEQEQKYYEQEKQNLAELDRLWLEQEQERMQGERNQKEEQQSKLERKKVEQERQDQIDRVEFMMEVEKKRKVFMDEERRKKQVEEVKRLKNFEILQQKKKDEAEQRRRYIQAFELADSIGEKEGLYHVYEERKYAKPRNNFDLEIDKDYEEIMRSDQKPNGLTNQLRQRYQMENQELETGAGGEDWYNPPKGSKVKSTKPKEKPQEQSVARNKLLREQQFSFRDDQDQAAKRANQVKPQITREDVIRAKDKLFPQKKKIAND